MFTTHLHLVLRLRMRRAIPHLPLYAFMAYRQLYLFYHVSEHVTLELNSWLRSQMGHLIESISHNALFWIVCMVLYLYFMLQCICSFNFVFPSSDSLRTGRSGDRIPVGARFSAPVQTGPGAYPASYAMGTGSLSRG
jgi:hypothetical protein